MHVSCTAYYYVRMRSCNSGGLCVVFVCGSRSSCNFFLFYTLCTEFTMFRFASHIFSVVPCTVHSDLAYAAYSYSSGSFLTVLVSICIFFFYVFSCFLSFCCVSTLSSVLCRIVVHVRCFVWYPCCFCVLIGVFVSLEKRSCFLVVFECL